MRRSRTRAPDERRRWRWENASQRVFAHVLRAQPFASTGGRTATSASFAQLGRERHERSRPRSRRPPERRALSLGTANAVDYALQFLLPMVLARTLDAAHLRRVPPAVAGGGHPDGGHADVHGAGALLLPAALRPARRSASTSHQTLVFLGRRGLVSALALSPWNPLLPGELRAAHRRYGALVPAFVLLWVVASLLDMPADGRGARRAGRPERDRRHVGCCARWRWSPAALADRRAGAVLSGCCSRQRRSSCDPALATSRATTAWAGRGSSATPFADAGAPGAPFGALQLAVRAARAGRPVDGRERSSRCTSFAAFSVAAVLGPLVHALPPVGERRVPAQHEPAAGRRRRARHDGAQQPRQLHGGAAASTRCSPSPSCSPRRSSRWCTPRTYLEAVPVMRALHRRAAGRAWSRWGASLLLLRQGGVRAARSTRSTLALSVAVELRRARCTSAWPAPPRAACVASLARPRAARCGASRARTGLPVAPAAGLARRWRTRSACAAAFGGAAPGCSSSTCLPARRPARPARMAGA